MTSAQVSGPAGQLSVDDGGSGGLLVLFLHSMAGSSAHWSEQLAYLRATQRAIAVDLRGHGRSERPRDGDYSFAGMAADVQAVVAALHIPRLVLVGHSLGGGVALTYAGLHPDRVAGLLLLDPVGDGTQYPSEEVRSFLSKLESHYSKTVEAYRDQIAGPNSLVRDRLRIDLRATPRETVARTLHAVMKYDPHPMLGQYRGPMLSIVTPQNDEAFSLHRLGRGFPHRIVQGTGHWIQLDRPDVVNEMLDEFLGSLSRVEKP